MRKLFTVFLLVLSNQTLLAQSSDNYKSLLLYKFSEYIIWPGQNPEVKVGLVGSQNVFNRVASFAAKRDHMNVVSIHNAGQLGDCDMVFLSAENAEQLKIFRAKIQSNSVLVVSELKEDIRRGADIVIFEENGRMKYIMNEGTMKAKGLIVSKKLASLGHRS